MSIGLEISINEIQTPDGILLASCDLELLGKSFEENGLHLNVKEDFYGGENVTIDKFEEKLKAAYIANLVGKKTVNKAIELGLISKSAVITIQGIPHAQIVNI